MQYSQVSTCCADDLPAHTTAVHDPTSPLVFNITNITTPALITTPHPARTATVHVPHSHPPSHPVTNLFIALLLSSGLLLPPSASTSGRFTAPVVAVAFWTRAPAVAWLLTLTPTATAPSAAAVRSRPPPPPPQPSFRGASRRGTLQELGLGAWWRPSSRRGCCGHAAGYPSLLDGASGVPGRAHCD